MIDKILISTRFNLFLETHLKITQMLSARSNLMMGDRPGGWTTSEYFDLRLSVLGVSDLPCAIKWSNNSNISKFWKKIKILNFAILEKKCGSGASVLLLVAHHGVRHSYLKYRWHIMGCATSNIF